MTKISFKKDFLVFFITFLFLFRIIDHFGFVAFTVTKEQKNYAEIFQEQEGVLNELDISKGGSGFPLWVMDIKTGGTTEEGIIWDGIIKTPVWVIYVNVLSQIILSFIFSYVICKLLFKKKKLSVK